MGRPYKICFLGYKRLGEIARKVIATLNYPDTLVVERSCDIYTLPEVVSAAQEEGFHVFISGSANATRFRSCSHDHLVEIRVGMLDYIYSLKRAVELGGKRIGIAQYRDNDTVDLSRIQAFCHLPVDLIYFEDHSELYEALEKSPCDIIIGASLATDFAMKLGKKSLMLYESEDTIRNTIARARRLAVNLREEARFQVIVNSIVQNSLSGIIVTDENGNIMLVNQPAKQFIGAENRKLYGSPLSAVAPALSFEVFLQNGVPKLDQRHLMNGSMVRCMQTRLEEGDDLIGMLTTMTVDNSHRKKRGEVSAPGLQARKHWNELIGNSVSFKNAVSSAKRYAKTGEHFAIIGESGTGRYSFAQCIHNDSPRSGSPFLLLDALSVTSQNSAAILFGNEELSGVRKGLLELADDGTIVLQNLADAPREFSACLLQAVRRGSFLRIGGTSPVPFRARILTLASEGEIPEIPDELRHLLFTFTLNLPPLRKRENDVPLLFQHFFKQEKSVSRHKVQKGLDELLLSYSWPGNLEELNAVCKRYIFSLEQSVNPSLNARTLILLRAIGEDAVLKDLFLRYPALKTPLDSPAREVTEGVAAMKQLLKYNNDMVAGKLGLSRTTLWSISKKSASEKE